MLRTTFLAAASLPLFATPAAEHESGAASPADVGLSAFFPLVVLLDPNARIAG